MISALLCSDRAVIEEKYKSAGIKLNEKSNCLLVKDNAEELALCLFELDNKSITVLHLNPANDIVLADFTLRSTLHIAAERWAIDARFADTAPAELFEKLGFVLDKEQKTLDINKLFKSCCGCGK